MAPLSRLLSLAALLTFLAGSAAAESSPSCPDSYQEPSYRETWAIQRPDWLKGCAEGKSAQDLLAEGRRRFAEGCQKDAQPLIRDGRMDAEALKRLCAQGRPGRAKIPGLALAPAVPISPPTPSAGLEKGGRKIAAWTEGVHSTLQSGKIPALYSEKAPVSAVETAAAFAAGAAQPVPKPPTESESQTEREPASKQGERSTSPPPLESTPYDDNIETIVGRVIRHEASAESHQHAQRVIRVMTSEIPPPIVENIVDNKAQVEIIPKDKKLTDLPNFKPLKGKKTFDGRIWDDVRGAANMRTLDGGVACAIPEENLLPGRSGYIRFYVLAHEYGHIVMVNGLPEKTLPQKRTRPAQTSFFDGLREPSLAAFYDNLRSAVAAAPKKHLPGQDEVELVYTESMKRPEKTGLGEYADSTKGEMFAEAAACYFGVNSPVSNAVALKKVNNELHGVTERTFGTPRKISL